MPITDASNINSIILAWVIGGAIGMIALYVVVRFAVLHALRAHSVWERDGGLDDVLRQHEVTRERWNSVSSKTSDSK